MNSEEIDGGASVAVDFEAAKDGEITVKSNGVSKKTFKFDAVFSPEADQSNIALGTMLFFVDSYKTILLHYFHLRFECSACF